MSGGFEVAREFEKGERPLFLWEDKEGGKGEASVKPQTVTDT